MTQNFILGLFIIINLSPIIMILYWVWRDYYKDLNLAVSLLDDIEKNPEFYTKMHDGIFKMEYHKDIDKHMPSFENTLFIQEDYILCARTDIFWRRSIASSRLKSLRNRAIYLFNQLEPYGSVPNYTYESLHEELSPHKEA